jgi:hypothetical protein
VIRFSGCRNSLNRRLIQPAIHAGVEKALVTQPSASDTSVVAEVSLEKAVGQPHNASYPLLYSTNSIPVYLAVSTSGLMVSGVPGDASRRWVLMLNSRQPSRSNPRHRVLAEEPQSSESV